MSSNTAAQDVAFRVFDRIRGLTDADCRVAETALLAAAWGNHADLGEFDALDLSERPDRAFRYGLLASIRAIQSNMAAVELPASEFATALDGLLGGDARLAAQHLGGERLRSYKPD